MSSRRNSTGSPSALSPAPRRGRLQRRIAATGVIAALCFIAAPLPSCDQAPPSTPPRTAADISVPPGLSVIADVSEPLIFSVAAIKGDQATPLSRGRLMPRAGRTLEAAPPPPGSAVRLRVAAAPTPQRGEEMAWIKPAAEAGGELAKAAGVAEYIYPGGDVVARISRDEGGRLVIGATPAPGGAPK